MAYCVANEPQVAVEPIENPVSLDFDVEYRSKLHNLQILRLPE